MTSLNIWTDFSPLVLKYFDEFCRGLLVEWVQEGVPTAPPQREGQIPLVLPRLPPAGPTWGRTSLFSLANRNCKALGLGVWVSIFSLCWGTYFLFPDRWSPRSSNGLSLSLGLQSCSLFLVHTHPLWTVTPSSLPLPFLLQS